MARRAPRGWPPIPAPLPVPVVDNHTHLDVIGSVLPPERVVPMADQRQSGADDRFGGDREAFALLDPWAGERHPSVSEHLDRARGVGVDRVVQVGCDLPSARGTDALLRGFGEPLGDADVRALLGAVAIHPNEAVLHAGVVETGPDGLAHRPGPDHEAVDLDAAIAEIAGIAAANPRVRAIGETGMDLFRTGPRGAVVQREAFRAHIALAKELGLALQIHDRDAHSEVLDVLDRDGAPERTVFHCYSGDAAMARHCAERGWFLSFAGPVTYPANSGLRAALVAVPLDQVMVETDAPYLPPHPYRGRPNAPYVVAHTVRAVAEVLDRDLAEVCDRISRTSVEVYGPW